MNQEQQDNAINQVIAKCWADESFKQASIADPKATLAAAGYPVPDHITINIVEKAQNHVTMVIPLNRRISRMKT
jgi:hypothetical protein